MPTPFSRTMRALQADRFRGSAVTLACSFVLLTAWAWWLFAARITVHAVTADARLEVDRAVHTVEAPVSGRLGRVLVSLEQPVAAGTVLFELDAQAETLRLTEALAYRQALLAQREALDQQRSTGTRALGEAAEVSAASLDEARARYTEASAAARLAEGERNRLRPLHERGVISDAEYQRTVADATQRAAAADALLQALRRFDAGGRQQRTDRRAELDKLNREMAGVDGELASTTATIARLRHEIAQRQVTAPIAGRVGEVAELREGAFVAAGDRLASVVPIGSLRVVARFEPSTALGRIAPGQAARVRLDGFPSTRYGAVHTVVSRVGSEVQDGSVRVELAVQPDAATRIPLQHGLPGTAEVQVERLSPAALLLRQAGRLVQAQ